MIKRNKLVKKDLNLNNEKAPRGVCNTCRKLPQKIDQGDVIPLRKILELLVKVEWLKIPIAFTSKYSEYRIYIYAVSFDDF